MQLEQWQIRSYKKHLRERKVWKKLYPKKFFPTLDPTWVGVASYTCSMCEEVYYFKDSDEESPTYVKLKGRYNSLCHACLHAYSPRTNCRICQLRKAYKEARRRLKIQSKLGEENTLESRTAKAVTWVSAASEQTRVRRGTGLSTRRGRNKNKKERGSRRRRSSRVS